MRAYEMKEITGIIWNPVIYIIQFFMKRFELYEHPHSFPKIKYRREFLIKSPEKTIKEGFANCINKALLFYCNYFWYFRYNGCFSGIGYFKRPNSFHSDFVVLDREIYTVKDKGKYTLIEDKEFYFIMPKKIYKVQFK